MKTLIAGAALAAFLALPLSAAPDEAPAAAQ